MSDDLAIIGTLDFFPPLVDDPRTFGEIAAANALSDVFAMGGRVLFALSIAAFPEDLPRDVMTEIFAGASAKVREAGGTLAGGHTIRDPEPKYGLAVIGAAHPDHLLRKGGARAGRPAAPDQAARHRRAGVGRPPGPDERRGPRDRHRRDAPPQPGRLGGAGRGRASARRRTSPGSGCSATAWRWPARRAPGSSSTRRRCPALPGALELAAAGVETGGAAHNRRYVAGSLAIGPDVRPELVTLAHDPQTSGGLLAAVAPDRVDAIESAFDAAGVEHWWIGRVEAGEPGVSLA